MVEFRHVSKVYGRGRGRPVPALTGVTFAVGRDEMVCLFGPSGAGKTTVLRLVSREELPTEGEVVVAGEEVSRFGPRAVAHLRRRIGIVFQDGRLLADRTVAGNVAFVLRVQGTPRHELRERVLEALRSVGLHRRPNARLAELSAEGRQRLALARALVTEPPLLLADEPTGSLDGAAAGEILEVLRGVHARGATLIVATHQRAVAERLQCRTLRLAGGRLEGEMARAGDG